MEIKQYTDTKDYFSVILPEKNIIRLYAGRTLIKQIDKQDINAVVFMGDSYLYTKKKSSCIEKKKLDGSVLDFVINEYDEVVLLKYIDETRIVLQGVSVCAEETDIFIYNLREKKVCFTLPISMRSGDVFQDICIFGNNIMLVGCFTKYKSTSLFDCEDIYVMLYSIEDNVSLIDKLSVDVIYDDFEDRVIAIERTLKNLQFPLFKHYLYHWLRICSITSGTTKPRILYYSKDFHGLIVCDAFSGTVCRLIALPERYKEVSSDIHYFYNDNTGVLSLVNGEGVEQYYVNDSDNASGNEIDIVNQKYKDAVQKNINLQKHIDGYSFKRAFYRAIDAVVLERFT